MTINTENVFCVFGYDFSRKKFVVNGSEKQSAFLNIGRLHRFRGILASRDVDRRISPNTI